MRGSFDRAQRLILFSCNLPASGAQWRYLANPIEPCPYRREEPAIGTPHQKPEFRTCSPLQTLGVSLAALGPCSYVPAYAGSRSRLPSPHPGAVSALTGCDRVSRPPGLPHRRRAGRRSTQRRCSLTRIFGTETSHRQARGLRLFSYPPNLHHKNREIAMTDTTETSAAAPRRQHPRPAPHPARSLRRRARRPRRPRAADVPLPLASVKERLTFIDCGAVRAWRREHDQPLSASPASPKRQLPCSTRRRRVVNPGSPRRVSRLHTKRRPQIPCEASRLRRHAATRNLPRGVSMASGVDRISSTLCDPLAVPIAGSSRPE